MAPTPVGRRISPSLAGSLRLRAAGCRRRRARWSARRAERERGVRQVTCAVTVPTCDPAGQASAANCSGPQKSAFCGLPSRPGASRTNESFTSSVARRVAHLLHDRHVRMAARRGLAGVTVNSSSETSAAAGATSSNDNTTANASPRRMGEEDTGRRRRAVPVGPAAPRRLSGGRLLGPVAIQPRVGPVRPRAAPSCVPCSATRPWSSTTIRPAPRIVDRRWAITSAVRPASSRRSPRSIWASVRTSTFEVASSRIRMRGSAAAARANATSWRWPADRCPPRSPTSVS